MILTDNGIRFAKQPRNAADIGRVTDHSYIVYGPLANGATTLMFEKASGVVIRPRVGDLEPADQSS